MGTLSALLASSKGIRRSPVLKVLVMWSFGGFFRVNCTSCWTNNPIVGDLRWRSCKISNVRLPNFVSTLISSLANNGPVWRHRCRKGTLDQTSWQRVIFTNYIYRVYPVYRGWLYVFVPVRTPLPAPPPVAEFSSRNNKFYRFLSFLVGLMDLTYSLPD